MPAVDPGGPVLMRAIEALSGATALEVITATVASAAREIAAADGATFVLREDGQCFYADEDAVGPLWKGRRFPASACISGWAMDHRETAIVTDISEDERIPLDAYRPTFVRSLAMIPVRVEEPVAAVGIYWRDHHTPDAKTLRQLEILANSASVALENLELRAALGRRARERDASAARADELEAAIHSLVHDLRSPLGVMIGYAELISDEAADDDTARRAAAILRSADRVTTQIERMLSIYRITSHRIAPERLDLTALAREVAAELRAEAGERDVQVVVEDALEIVADPVLTRLLLANLLSNALTSTAREPHARIRLFRAEHGHPLATFAVRDNGIGFDQADAATLFRPLVRPGAAEDAPGTGLGLASVARIVARHGGRVRAEGTPGEGATFFFSLPVPD